MKNIYQIFGQNILVNTIAAVEGTTLHDELSSYPTTTATEIDLEINYVGDHEKIPILSSNPSIHKLFEGGFEYTMGPVCIRIFYKDRKPFRIDFSIKKSSKWMQALNKLLNIQFTNHKEAIGQWFHEYILVPYVLNLKDQCLIHSSAVKINNGQAVLFGGTGGVGKTSLEIELCRNRGASFIADDISVVTSDGMIYSNLAYPKVYGYNMKGDKEIRKVVFRKAGMLNKLFFWVHATIRGDQYVRRRISPESFYGKCETESCEIGAYLILTKAAVNKIELHSIDKSEATDLSDLVISREYSTFFDHLVWHKYNSEISHLQPQLTYEEAITKNREVMLSAFSKIKHLFIVKIPLQIGHAEFKKALISLLEEKEII